MLQHDVPKKNYEQTGNKATEIHSHHCLYCDTTFPQFDDLSSIQCEQFKEKLGEIRGWGQADRHFAAYYRLFLN
jgi:hypothetical protein